MTDEPQEAAQNEAQPPAPTVTPDKRIVIRGNSLDISLLDGFEVEDDDGKKGRHYKSDRPGRITWVTIQDSGGTIFDRAIAPATAEITIVFSVED